MRKIILVFSAIVLLFVPLLINVKTSQAEQATPQPDNSTNSSNLSSVQSVVTVSSAGITSLSDLPDPPWWSGKVCDTNKFPGSFTRGNFRNVQVCGPNYDDGYVEKEEFNFGGNKNVTIWEWQCVEFVRRYMYLAYGTVPYNADGNQIYNNYPGNTGTVLKKIPNRTKGDYPKIGDVISFGGLDSKGDVINHASIVIDSYVDNNGNGWFKTLNQNWGGTNSHISPISQINISNWVAGGGAIGWLRGPNDITGVINTPGNNSDLKGTIQIQGWAKVDGSSINQIQIWIDNVNRGNATYNLSDSTYSWTWDTRLYNDSLHQIRVKATASNGVENWLPILNDDNQTALSIFSDNSPPSAPTHVYTDCGAQDRQWQNYCDNPTFYWDSSTDFSGVQDYHIYFGQDAQGQPNLYRTTPSLERQAQAVPGPISTSYLLIAPRDTLGNQPAQPVQAFTFLYDAAQPEGSVQIDNGAASTSNTNVTLNVNASDAGSGLHQLRTSLNQIDWTPWEDYKNSISMTLPALDRHDITVYVQISDWAGNSTTLNASTYLNLDDSTPHSTSYRICLSSIDAAGSAGLLSQSYQLTSALGQGWSGDGSNPLGIGMNTKAGFLANLTGCQVSSGLPATNYQLGTSVIASSGNIRGSASFNLVDTFGQALVTNTNQPSSSSYILNSGFWSGLDVSPSGRSNVQDDTYITGNPEPTVQPTPQPDSPQYQIQINNGAVFTNSQTVKLQLIAPNATLMKLSNTDDYSDDGWQAYQPELSWDLNPASNTSSPSTVYAWFRNALGDQFGVYYDQITLDTVPPEGVIGFTYMSQDSSEIWAYAWDDISGVNQMRFADDPTSINNNNWLPYSESPQWTPSGDQYYAQFMDQAGNLSPIYQSEVRVTLSNTIQIFLPVIKR